jgi:hypothetical protein
MSSRTMRILESMDHSAVKEYRIKDGKVEARILDCGSDQESAWWELTPEQLSIHVRRNTAVARWVERTLGWRPLLRACVGQ